jgi:hypothetical protein
MYETGNRVLIYYSSSPRLGLAPSVLVMPRFPLPANRAATASHADSDQQGGQSSPDARPLSCWLAMGGGREHSPRFLLAPRLVPVTPLLRSASCL